LHALQSMHFQRCPKCGGIRLLGEARVSEPLRPAAPRPPPPRSAERKSASPTDRMRRQKTSGETHALPLRVETRQCISHARTCTRFVARMAPYSNGTTFQRHDACSLRKDERDGRVECGRCVCSPPCSYRRQALLLLRSVQKQRLSTPFQPPPRQSTASSNAESPFEHWRRKKLIGDDRRYGGFHTISVSALACRMQHIRFCAQRRRLWSAEVAKIGTRWKGHPMLQRGQKSSFIHSFIHSFNHSFHFQQGSGPPSLTERDAMSVAC
jgi:hypothetical protein